MVLRQLETDAHALVTNSTNFGSDAMRSIGCCIDCLLPFFRTIAVVSPVLVVTLIRTEAPTHILLPAIATTFMP